MNVARIWSLLYGKVEARVQLLVQSPETLIRNHKFFSIPRRDAFKLPESGEIFFVFGANGEALTKIASFFRGATVIYVRPTRRGNYTAGTARLLRKIGARARLVCATREAHEALAARDRALADRAAVALLSPLGAMTADKGVEGLWLRPARADASAPLDPALERIGRDVEQMFARPWARGADNPRLVLFGSSLAGLAAQMEDRAREQAAPRGEPGQETTMAASPLALDGAARRPAELPSAVFGQIWRAADRPTVSTGDDALAAVLTLGGFPMVEGEARPADEARASARALVLRSLADTRFIAAGSKRLIDRDDAFARLGLGDDAPAATSDLASELLAVGAVDAVGARILGRDVDSGEMSAEGRAVLRQTLRREAAAPVSRLGQRVDLVDDFLDFAAPRLQPIDRPAAVLLRLGVTGDEAGAAYDLGELLREHGAQRALLAEIAERFAARPGVLTRLAAKLVREESNRAALAVLEVAAARPDAGAEVLSLAAERQLELGMLPEALATARRLSALAPDDPAVAQLRLAAGDAGAETGAGGGAADMLVAAERAHLAGQTELAEQIARRALSRAAGRLAPAVASGLTDFLLARNQTDEALDIALSRFGDSADRARARDAAALALAELQGFVGDGEAARATLRAAERHGSSAAAARLRALVARSGGLEQEIAGYREIYRAKKGLPQLRHLMSMLAAAGRADEAIELAAEAKADEVGREVDVDFALGEILTRSGRWREALDALASAQEPGPYRVQALILVARCRRGLGDLDGARAAWTLVLESGQARQAARLALAEIAETSGLYADAAEHYGDVLRNAPLSRAVVQPWAAALRLARALPAARASLERLAATTAEASPAFWLSAIEAEAGRLDAALARARGACEAEPLNVNLARNLIDLLGLDADFEGARAVVARLEPMFEARPTRLAETAEIWRTLGEADRANACIERALKLAPRNPAILMTAARIAFEREDFETAHQYARASLDVDPLRMGGYFLAARIARRLGRPEEADALASTAAAVWPDRTLSHTAAVENAIAKRDAAAAVASMDVVESLRTINGDKPQIRMIWSAAALAGEAGDHAAFMRFARQMTQAIYGVFPPDLGLWTGAPFRGQRMLTIARGGPGDEVRLYYAALRRVAAEASHLTHVGDPRLESLFRRNFPGHEFVANPWTGRRLGRRREAITDEMRKGLAQGTLEALRRFGSYLPQKAVDAAHNIAVADALWEHRLFPVFGDTHAPEAPAPLVCDPAKLAAARAFLDGLPPGPRVGVSWRASYASANRFTGGFFHVEDAGAFLSVPGAVFVDLHPNVVDEEFARAVELAGGRLYRGPFDLQNDFEALAALSASLDAVITPGVTQRDVAAAFREGEVWSFNLAPEYSERWRIDAEGRDRFQPRILHHDFVSHGDRASIAAALAARVRDLVAARGEAQGA